MRFLHTLISNGLARIALPFFFAVSGTRFFHGLSGRPVATWYWPKLSRRLKSLGVPYLFWVLGFVLIVDGARSLLGTSHYSASLILNRVFLSPVPVPLWYLRELIIYAALAPLIYLAVRYVGLPWLALLAVWWCVDPDPNRTVLVSRGLLFFSVGAYVSIREVHVDAALLHRWGPPLTAVWIALVLLKTALTSGVPWGLLHSASVMIGLLAMWSCYDRAPRALKTVLGHLAPYTFFVFAAHLSVVGAMSRLFWRLVGRPTPVADLCLHLLCPFATLAATLAIGHALRRYLPKVYALSTGWR
jgi:surface polysaccharide O-acyltransferase-like enzyme